VPHARHRRPYGSVEVGSVGTVVVGVDVPPDEGADEDEDEDELVEPELLAAVPCGMSSIVYRVPSAVFTSVTGWPTFTVSVCEPPSYEPPTTETFAAVAVSETSWNMGLDAGNAEPALTVSDVPLTEMTADVGAGFGADGGAGGAFGVVDVDVELGGVGGAGGVFGVVAVFVLVEGPDELNGSLLSKTENDSSWPVSAGGFTAAISDDELCDVALPVSALAVGSAAPRLGAAGNAEDVGAGAGVEVAVVSAFTCGRFAALPPPLRPIIVCTA
jgi:hypothetical protein